MILRDNALFKTLLALVIIVVNEQISIDVLEGAYQLINYDAKDEEALIRDFNLRYGDRYMDVLKRARELVSLLGGEDVSSKIRRFYELLADHSMGKVRGGFRQCGIRIG
ncbi:hypothetical protein [Vulcanisaeta distributa]|uniref:hypothetical protein n=1 Tax=Vulcanisaeta distributa TaxID=164451 RepID=UPI000A685A07|nr:hypothetical protein [Vulcanisaeta distributa]